jgi:hypothetical protein
MRLGPFVREQKSVEIAFYLMKYLIFIVKVILLRQICGALNKIDENRWLIGGDHPTPSFEVINKVASITFLYHGAMIQKVSDL